jgi:histone H3/H4
MYSTLRQVMKGFIGTIVSKSVYIMNSTQHSTMLPVHVKTALSQAGMPMYGSVKKGALPKRCAVGKLPSRTIEAQEGMKGHRGLGRAQNYPTATMMVYGRGSDGKRITKTVDECYMLPVLPVHKMIKKIAEEYPRGSSYGPVRLSKEAAAIIQLATEGYLVKYLSLSVDAATHAHRVRVFNKNLALMKKN